MDTVHLANLAIVPNNPYVSRWNEEEFSFSDFHKSLGMANHNNHNNDSSTDDDDDDDDGRKKHGSDGPCLVLHTHTNRQDVDNIVVSHDENDTVCWRRKSHIVIMWCGRFTLLQ